VPFVFAVLLLSVVRPEIGDPRVWYGVGAVYALTIGFAGVLRYWLSRPPSWGETVGAAAVVTLLLLPMTPLLFVEFVQSTPPFQDKVIYVLLFHLHRFAPVAFMFPLGAAKTLKDEYRTVLIIVASCAAEPFSWMFLFLHVWPRHFTDPSTLVTIAAFWLFVLTSLGSPLFLLGRGLTRPVTGN